MQVDDAGELLRRPLAAHTHTHTVTKLHTHAPSGDSHSTVHARFHGLPVATLQLLFARVFKHDVNALELSPAVRKLLWTCKHSLQAEYDAPAHDNSRNGAENASSATATAAYPGH